MRSIVLALAVSACSSSNNSPVPIHEVEPCDASWVANGFQQCEAACVDSATALGATGTSCAAATTDGSSVSCSKTFSFEGATGCCAAATPAVLFAECM